MYCLLPLQVVGIVLVLTCRLQTMLGTCRCTLLVPGEVLHTVWRADVVHKVKSKELRIGTRTLANGVLLHKITSLHKIVRPIIYTAMLVIVTDQ